jgi:hypothetical protein
MGLRILSNDVLMNNEHKLRIRKIVLGTHCLTPGPIPGHKVLEAMSTISRMLLEGCVIKIGFEIRVREEVVDQGARVPKPDVIFSFHPRWNVASGFSSIILQSERFPGNITEGSGVNCIVHVGSCRKWRSIIVDGKRCSPEVENKIDVPGGHLIAAIQEVSNFKFETIIVRCPVIRTLIGIAWRRWHIRRYVIAVLIADPSYNK